MRAVVCRATGGPEVLELDELPDPEPLEGEVAISVVATAVNRADLMQRQGGYPPPPGAPETLGLECSGTIAAVGPGVTAWSVGDEVCALLSGGGYAEIVVVPQGQVLPAPRGLDLVLAAALPEVACTVWSNVFMVAGLRAEELLLVHGGSSGIGTMSIQLAKQAGARVACTVGSPEKRAACLELGADLVVEYRDQDFVDELHAFEPDGADVILDNMGAVYLARNIDALAIEGRLVVIGMQGGARGELDLSRLMRKRAAVIATTLRARPVDEKSAIVASVREHVWPLVESGDVRPVVYGSFSLADAADAHRLVESSAHIGKVLLTT